MIPIAPTTPPAAISAAQIITTSWNAETDSLFGANESPTSLLAHDDADERDGDQPGDAGDRVVDGRGDAGVGLVGIGEHRRRQRRDRHREPDREDAERGEQVGEVGRRACPMRASSRMPAAATSGPAPMKKRGP